MIYSNYRISLDVRSIGSQIVLNCKRCETGRRIYITLTEGLKAYTISDDCTAVFTAIKPDGNLLYNECAIENNCIVYTFTPQTAAAVGKMECEIRLYGADDTLLISALFGILVSDAVVDDGEVIESAFESDVVQKMIDEKLKEYLEESSVVVDTTLTTPGAAADAKATGDAITALGKETGEQFESMGQALNDMRQSLSETDAALQELENKALLKTGGTMTGAVTLNGIYLTPGEDFGDEWPENPPDNKLFFKKVT